MQRLTPWNWLGIRAWSGLLTLAAMFGLAASAHAALITKNGTPVFADDFEGQTPLQSGQNPPTTAGIALSANGVQGSWGLNSNGNTAAQLRVTDENDPGAYQGDNYLKINRSKNTGSSGSRSSIKQAIAEGFASPFAIGDHMQISFAYNWGAGGTGEAIGNGEIELQLLNTGSDDEKAIFISSGATIDFYGPTDGYDQPVASSQSLKGASGEWHTFSLHWKVGKPNVHLNIDGQGWETVLGALEGDALGWIPDRMALSTTRPGVISYDFYDAPQYVPEPNAIALAMAGVIGLGALRRRTLK